MPNYTMAELREAVRKMHKEKGARPVLSDFEYKFGAPKKHDFDYYGGFPKVMSALGYPEILDRHQYDEERLLVDFEKHFRKVHQDKRVWPNGASITADRNCACFSVYRGVFAKYCEGDSTEDIMNYLLSRIGAPKKPLPWSRKSREDFIVAVSNFMDEYHKMPIKADFNRPYNELPPVYEVEKKFEGGIRELIMITRERRAKEYVTDKVGYLIAASVAALPSANA